MTSISNISKSLTSILSNLNNFHPSGLFQLARASCFSDQHVQCATWTRWRDPFTYHWNTTNHTIQRLFARCTGITSWYRIAIHVSVKLTWKFTKGDLTVYHVFGVLFPFTMFVIRVNLSHVLTSEESTQDNHRCHWCEPRRHETWSQLAYCWANVAYGGPTLS